MTAADLQAALAAAIETKGAAEIIAARQAVRDFGVTALEFQAALKALDMTVAQFATRTGVNRSTVHRWLQADRVPTIAVELVKAWRLLRAVLQSTT